MYVGRVVPTEVSTLADESTNEDRSRDRGSLAAATVVVFATGPQSLSLHSPSCTLLGSFVACFPYVIGLHGLTGLGENGKSRGMGVACITGAPTGIPMGSGMYILGRHGFVTWKKVIHSILR